MDRQNCDSFVLKLELLEGVLIIRVTIGAVPRLLALI